MAGKRRDYGDGALYQRSSDNRWVGSFRANDGTRKSVYGKTKQEAKRKMEDAKRKASQGTLVAASRQTLSEYLDYWLSTIAKSVEMSTVQNYRSHLVRARNLLGRVQIQKLTRQQVQKYVHSLSDDELAASTVRLMFTILDIALAAAVEWKYLEENPCNHIILPKVDEKEQQFLTPDEAKRLLRFAVGHALEPVIALALGAGMRIGEICALRWQDINFDTDMIRVDHAVRWLKHDDGKYRHTERNPKTRAGKRSIPLSGFVKEALQRHRKRQVRERLEATTWNEKDLIFCTRKGTYMHSAPLYRKYHKLLEIAGLPMVKLHELRHSCNTLLRHLGIDAVTRQKILGHARPQITEEVYGHSYVSLQQEAMEKLDHLITCDGLDSLAK